MQTVIRLSTEGFADVRDLSESIDRFLDPVDGPGLLNVFVPGSTAGVTTIEHESGCVADLRRALEDIAPEDRDYKHNEKWGDGNGFSHLRAALLGPAVTLPVGEDGTPRNGTWQQVVLVDCDNRPREREVCLTYQPQ